MNIFKKRELIEKNSIEHWKIYIIIASIISLAHVNWGLIFVTETIIVTLLLKLFFYGIKKAKEVERKRIIESEDFIKKFIDLNEKGNSHFYARTSQIHGSSLSFINKSHKNDESCSPLSFTYDLINEKIYFYFEHSSWNKKEFQELQEKSVSYYLDFIGLKIKEGAIKNADSKLKEVSNVTQLSLFNSRLKGSSFKIEITKKREMDSIKTNLIKNYLVLFFAATLVPVIVISMILPDFSFTLMFFIILLSSRLIGEKTKTIVGNLMEEQKSKLLKDKATLKIAEIKNGIKGNLSEIKSIQDSKYCLNEKPMFFESQEQKTGFENIYIDNKGAFLNMTLKINGKQIEKEFINILKDSGLELNQIFSEESLDLYELNFSY